MLLHASRRYCHGMTAASLSMPELLADTSTGLVEKGNPNSVSDAGVGALAARAAVLGAGLNVKINASSLKDRAMADKLTAEADEMIERANKEERIIIEMVEKVIGK